MTDGDKHPPRGGSLTAAEVAIIDQGVRAYMLRIYASMAVGLAATGFAALVMDRLAVTVDAALASARLTDALTLSFLGHAALMGEFRWLLAVLPLGLVVLIGLRIERMGQAAPEAAFLGCTVLLGASLNVFFIILAGITIAPVFFAGAAAFTALAVCGHATGWELSRPGIFLVMALSGALVAGLTGALLPGSAGQLVASVAGVAILAALTAAASDHLKFEYIQEVACGGAAEKPAAQGARSLCLTMTNMMLLLPFLVRRSRRTGRAAPAGRQSGLPLGS
jgi:FtsH-binding integral membrane protein